MLRLVDAEPLPLRHSGVVLDQPVGDDDVADPECGIQPARDPGEDDQPWPHLGQQQGRERRHGDLADAGLGQDDVFAVECRDPGGESRVQIEPALSGRGVAQGCQLLRQGRDNRDRLPAHLSR